MDGHDCKDVNREYTMYLNHVWIAVHGGLCIYCEWNVHNYALFIFQAKHGQLAATNI